MAKLKSIIFIFSVLIISVLSQNSTNKNRTLNYYLNGLIFSIVEKENYFDIITKQEIYCIRAPCIPPVISTTSVKKEEDIKILKSLFSEIFSEIKVTEKPLIDDDLTSEQIDKLFKVFEDNNIAQALKYKIIKNLGYYDSNYSKRGFYTEGNGLNYTIASGQRPSGGYSIEVNKVKIKGTQATIYVKESKPSGGSITVLTYPIARVVFNIIPTSVTVINYDNSNEIFPKII
jgi:hypothetical protein